MHQLPDRDRSMTIDSLAFAEGARVCVAAKLTRLAQCGIVASLDDYRLLALD